MKCKCEGDLELEINTKHKKKLPGNSLFPVTITNTFIILIIMIVIYSIHYYYDIYLPSLQIDNEINNYPNKQIDTMQDQIYTENTNINNINSSTSDIPIKHIVRNGIVWTGTAALVNSIIHFASESL